MNPKDLTENGLAGQFLIAMPGIGDHRFRRSVILICSHSDQGAMGIVVNKRSGAVGFTDLLEKLDIDPGFETDTPVRNGGPVERGRGFVLHSHDYDPDGSLDVDGKFLLNGKIDILRAIANQSGPEHHLIALGYTGWGPGQLEQEIRDNGWLACPAESEIVFSYEDESKWSDALAIIGISPEVLSVGGGSA